MTTFTRVRALVVVCLFVVGVPTLSFAQERPVQIGVLVGVVSSTLTSENSGDSFTSKRGYSTGMFVAPRINKRAWLELEGLVIEKGAVDHFSQGPQTYTLRMVEVPVLGRVSLTPARSRVGVYTLGGVALDVRLRYWRTLPPELLKFGTDLAPGFKVFGFDAVAGAGVELSALRVEVRYNTSLSDISIPDAGRGVRSRVVSVLVGYRVF